MKLLKDILYRAQIENVVGSTNVAVEHITMDSRNIQPFSLFIAVKGTVSDGHNFIHTAIEKGALAVVCEVLPESIVDGVTYVQVISSQEALGFIASNFFDCPSEKLRVVAITGTNGKTTTTTLLYKLAISLGYKCGLISTVVNRINNIEIPATHTTPDAITMNSLLARMVNEGCEFCFMEASSHAIHQHRIAGIKFTGAVFTNITHDHLDYHQTFSEYIKAKKLLFDLLPSSAFAIANVDDRNGMVMLQNCQARKKTFALKGMADYKARVIENAFSGLHLMIDGHELYTRLIGGFNAYNILAVYATACELGLSKLEALTQISQLDSVEGRFQYIKTNDNVTAIVDYAHTPDALKNVLATIREIRTGNENVITLIGCGGDRDKTKRPLMAQIAANQSDRVILTSDNPRSEDPDAIIAEMKAGLDPIQMKKTVALVDRREAIRLACSLATHGDIILVAGKGHEKYQDIKGVRHEFDDFKIVSESLNSFTH